MGFTMRCVESLDSATKQLTNIWNITYNTRRTLSVRYLCTVMVEYSKFKLLYYLKMKYCQAGSYIPSEACVSSPFLHMSNHKMCCI